MEPILQSGETLIARVDAAPDGQWPETWLTNKGIHLRETVGRFVPFTDISAIHYEYQINRQEQVKFLRDSEVVADIRLNQYTAEKIRDIVARERIRSWPHKTPSRKIDENQIQWIAQNNTLSLTRGLFGQKTEKRFATQAKKSLEELIGEPLRHAFDAVISRRGYYEVTPTFSSFNWIIQIKEGRDKFQAVAVLRRDIVFSYYSITFRLRCDHTSPSSSGMGSFRHTSSPSCSSSIGIYRDTISSSRLVYTPYSTKLFCPPVSWTLTLNPK